MGAVSFADEDDVSPATGLLEPFTDWVVHLIQGRAPATVQAYVSDARTVAGLLSGHLQRASAEPAVGGGRPPAAGISELVWAQAVANMACLTLGDLHPRNLAVVFAAFADDHQPSTRRRLAAAWSAFCEYLTRRGLLATNPMRDPRIERGPKPVAAPAPFEMTEVRKLLLVLTTSDVKVTSRKPWPARDSALAAVLVTTGIRLSEACGAHVGDLRERDDAATLQVLGKGSKYRTVPVAVPVLGVLETYLAERAAALGEPAATESLFVQVDGRAFTSRAMEHLVSRWYARAGIVPHGRTLVHALRHTFATQAVNSGASVVELQELLGHASLETSRRYLRSVGAGLRDAVEANAPARAVADLRSAAAR